MLILDLYSFNSKFTISLAVCCVTGNFTTIPQFITSVCSGTIYSICLVSKFSTMFSFSRSFICLFFRNTILRSLIPLSYFQFLFFNVLKVLFLKHTKHLYNFQSSTLMEYLILYLFFLLNSYRLIHLTILVVYSGMSFCFNFHFYYAYCNLKLFYSCIHHLKIPTFQVFVPFL